MTETARLDVVLEDNYSKTAGKILGLTGKLDSRARSTATAMDGLSDSATDTAKRLGWVVDAQGKYHDQSGRFVSAARRQAEGLETVGNKATATGRDLGQLEEKMDKLVRTSRTTTRLLKGVGVGFAAVVGAAVVRDITRAGFGMAELAGKVSTLRTSFKSLSQGAGVDPNRILNQIGRGANDTLSEVQALTLANTALATGVRPLVNNLGDVVGNVRSLSLALGRDATADISRFVGAIQKQERELLDDLTIVVGADEAYKKFAKSVGKSTGALTASERQTAFANEALRQLNTRVKELGPTTNEFADGVARASASFTNVKTSLGFLTAPAFTNAAKNLNEFFGNPAAQQGVAAIAGGLGALGVAAVKVATGFGTVLTEAGDFGPLAGKLRSFADSTTASFLGLSNVLKEIAGQLEKLKFVTPGNLDAGIGKTPGTGPTTKTEAPKPFDYAKLVKGIDDVGTAFGGLEPRLGRAAQTVVGFASSLKANPFGAWTIAASGMIDLLGGRGISAQEKYRNKLAETSRALNEAADAVAAFGDTAQNLTRGDLGGRVDAFKQLQGFGVGSDQDLKALFGSRSGPGAELAFEGLAKELGFGVREFERTLNDIRQQFPNVNLGKAGSFDALAGIADQAAAQIGRFGEFDKGTFSGAASDFSFQRSIARPDTSLQRLFEDSFGQLVKSFNTEDLSFALNEGVSLSSAQTRTLKELLAEIRDFHEDATQSDAIVERLVRERFRGEELAVRSRFAGRFSAAAGDPTETNRLLRDMTRELDALATEEKAFARAVSAGKLGAGLGTGLEGAAKGSSAAAGGGGGTGGGSVAEVLGLDTTDRLLVPINDVLTITGRISFLRWAQAVTFETAEPVRVAWTDTAVFEQAAELRHAPPDGYASLVDVGATTPPIVVNWPTTTLFQTDDANRTRPASWSVFADVGPGIPKIPATWPGITEITADPARRHSLGDWDDVAEIANAALLRRSWAEGVELGTYGRHSLGAWANVATIPGDAAKLQRAWSATVELLGIQRHTPGAWTNIATIPADTAKLVRTWPIAVDLIPGGVRHTPGAWANIATIPSDTARIVRGWPAAVDMIESLNGRHTPRSWAALAHMPADLPKFLRAFPDIVDVVQTQNGRHTPTTWGTLAHLPADLPKFLRAYPDIVDLVQTQNGRHTPATWGFLAHIPTDLGKFTRTWPSTVQLLQTQNNRHTPGSWATLAHLPTDLSRYLRAWPAAVDMVESLNGRHTPESFGALVNIPSSLQPIGISPVDFVQVVGEPVPVDINQLFVVNGQLALNARNAATYANPAPGQPANGPPLIEPFAYDATNGGGDFFANHWQVYNPVGG